MNYKWIGSIPEKDHYLIWGIIELDRAGFDPVANDNVNTYRMFSGRSDKKLTAKNFIDTEGSIIELIKRKQLKGYTLLSEQKFLELIPNVKSTLTV